MKYLLVLALIYSSQVLSAEEFTPLTEQQINDQRQRFKQYVQQHKQAHKFSLADCNKSLISDSDYERCQTCSKSVLTQQEHSYCSS